jgi:hypothetical protein
MKEAASEWLLVLQCGKPYNGRGNRGIGSVSLDTALAGDFSDHRSGQQRL